MPSQLLTSPNDAPMRGPMTMQPLSDEWTLVPEEGPRAPELPETQEESSDTESVDSWEELDENLDHPYLGTTPSQSQTPSDSGSPACSALIAPGLVDGCVPTAGSSAPSAADSGSALMTRPSLLHTDLEPDEVDIEPATLSGPGPYIEVSFEAAEPWGSEFDTCTFGPGTTIVSFGPEPLLFGSDPAIYSFGPWISPDESSALFSQGPTFLFFEPELVDSRAISFSGATHPTISGSSPPQSPRSAPETGVSPSLDISLNQDRPGPSYTIGHEPYLVGRETYTYGPWPSPNGPEISPSDSFGPEPSSAMVLTFGPASSANDRMMGPRPTLYSPASSANDRMMGPRPTLYSPYSSANDRMMGSRLTLYSPGSFSFGPRPDSYNPNMGRSQASLGPRTYANGDAYDPGMGPGPISFGPGPYMHGTIFGPNLNAYNNIIGPGPTSFGPGPTVLDPGTPFIMVEQSTVKRDSYKRFLCSPCHKGFERIEHMERHKATKSHADNLEAEGIPLNPITSPVVHSCPFCDRTFNRQDNLRPHLVRHMENNGSRSRTRQVSVDESIRNGLAYLDPRLILNLQCRSGKWEIVDEDE